MKKNLFLRTDILPEEIPILFSNSPVFSTFTEKKMEEINKYKQALKKTTVPLFFNIPKSKNETRKIGLLHPLAQVQAFNYILRYDQLIVSFCKNSPYSVRSPIKRNIPKIKKKVLRENEIKKIEEEYSFSEKLSLTSDEDQILFYNYFSYNRYKKITELYNSVRFNRDKYKYNFFLKLDIQRCFPSIYTHSLAWALFGDKSLAKKYRGNTLAFPNASDTVASKINFDETHGLVVGPEFSRIIAELLLTRIDLNIYNQATDSGLKKNKDYTIYRFIDDYFIFAKNHTDAEKIELLLKNELEKYNLTINVGKKELQEKPLNTVNNSILDLKTILNEFSNTKLLTATKNNIDFQDYLGSTYEWNFLFNKIENLITQHSESKTRLVNYFLKTIRPSIFLENEKFNKFSIVNILEVISNIYTLDVNSKSTTYFLSINIKLLNKLNLLKNNSMVALKDDITQESRINHQKSIENIDFILEKIFEHSFRVLKNNFNNLENMYDVLVFMKLLDKKIPASFLSKILDTYSHSYFICCSVGYYILNEEVKIDKSFYTVLKKLQKTINIYLNDYKSKGTDHPILEGEFFYFLNDFSKYPGFSDIQRSHLEKLLKAYTKAASFNGEKDFNDIQKEMWNSFTRSSFYNWHSKTDTFMRKIAKKSSHLSRLDTPSNY